MNAPEYICRSCKRVVDRELEASPGEPTTCADCYADLLRDWGKW